MFQRIKTLTYCFITFFITSLHALATPPDATLLISLDAGGVVRELGRFNSHQLKSSFKTTTRREQLPDASSPANWRGITLQDLLTKTLEPLTPEVKANIDLIILTSDSNQALIPRAVITKYPLLIAFEKDNKSTQHLQSVVPWTSRPKILEESLPLARYFIQGVTDMKLANLSERFGNLFLNRRTDPAAMRGEKLFVHNCIGCHGIGMGPKLSELRSEKNVTALSANGHPQVKGNPKLSARDQRAVLNYLNAFRLENPQGTSASATR